MILTWNVRGMNEVSRNTKIGSYLRSLHCACVGLLETRVKEGKVARTKSKLERWFTVDNYTHHANGRV